MGIIGYARVSTAGQDTLAQVEQLEAAGACRIFQEKVSGYMPALTRPQLSAALDYLRPGDTLAVVRLDRLGRDLADMLRVVDMLRLNGVELVSLHEGINTSTAHGGLIFSVMGALAHYEGQLRRERQDEAWRAGKQKGRPPTLTVAQHRELQRLHEEGHSLRDIAAYMRVSKTTVFRHIRRIEREKDARTDAA